MNNRRYHLAIGTRFGVLTVLSDDDSRGALCRCDCGTERLFGRGVLVKGEQKSCGCRVQNRGKAPVNKRHGLRHSREYTSWNQMVQRCRNESLASYKRYGALGVKVADEWVGPDGFDRFIAYVGMRPTPQHSIDRYPCRTGNYEPGNVRWATPREQAVNRRTTRLITFRGRTLCSKEWAVELNISRKSVVYRHERGIALDAPKKGSV